MAIIKDSSARWILYDITNLHSVYGLSLIILQNAKTEIHSLPDWSSAIRCKSQILKRLKVCAFGEYNISFCFKRKYVPTKSYSPPWYLQAKWYHLMQLKKLSTFWWQHLLMECSIIIISWQLVKNLIDAQQSINIDGSVTSISDGDI